MSNSKRYLETFVHEYVTTLLWVSTDTDEDGDTISLEEHYSAHDITSQTWEMIEEGCAAFLDLVWGKVPQCTERFAGDMGSNFALSRNGHGTGFWDLGWGEEGDALHVLSKTFGEQSLYVGDDDKLYVA